jgi:hypothetical protein
MRIPINNLVFELLPTKNPSILEIDKLLNDEDD